MTSQRFNFPRLPFRSVKKVPEDPGSSGNDIDRLSVEAESEDGYGSDGEDCGVASGHKKGPRHPGQEVSWTELDVQSKHIITALRKVIGSYDGIDFTSKTISIMEPPRCLFHYRDELHQYAEASVDKALRSHMQLFLQYTDKVLRQEMRVFNSFLSGRLLAPELEHSQLWMIFRPGCLVYEEWDGIGLVSRLRSIDEEEDEDTDDFTSWLLQTERVSFVRGKIGLTHHQIEIKHYSGRRPVFGLSAIPLHFHPEESSIKQTLLDRGREFISLFGMNHCYYDGAAQMFTMFRPGSIGPSQTNIKSRIMLDPEEFGRSVTTDTPDLIMGSKAYTSAEEATRNFSNEEIMTCIAHLPGYSLESRAWGLFHVPNITEVAYNDVAFEGLVLHETNKRLISSLVGHEPTSSSNGYDDLIQGKGRGLIFLLHGPPGVGKTYTAESIADHTRRPLLKVTSGELSMGGPWVEERLTALFSLATRWNAIILLDEADVFMQERKIGNIESNWLVSTLLRVLEYYQGILFLTTNRIETIDHAFKSRIHLAIAYPALSANARRQLWKSTMSRAHAGQLPEWLVPDILDQFVEPAINGREIRNIVATSLALARNEKRGLIAADIFDALSALKQFESDFNKSPGNSED